MEETQSVKPLTVDEAAALAGIGRNQFYAAVRDGCIPSLRIGRSIRIPRKKFIAWLEGEDLSAKGAA